MPACVEPGLVHRIRPGKGRAEAAEQKEAKQKEEPEEGSGGIGLLAGKGRGQVEIGHSKLRKNGTFLAAQKDSQESMQESHRQGKEAATKRFYPTLRTSLSAPAKGALPDACSSYCVQRAGSRRGSEESLDGHYPAPLSCGHGFAGW